RLRCRQLPLRPGRGAGPAACLRRTLSRCNASAPRMPHTEATMDLRKIKKLIDLLEESNLAEIEIKEGEESVRLSRIPQGVAVAAPAAALEVRSPAPAAAAPMPMSSPVEAATGGTPKPASDLPPGQVVRAPMVGTYYAA